MRTRNFISLFSAASVTLSFTAAVLLTVSCRKHSPQSQEEAMPVDVTEAVTDSVTLYHTYPATLQANQSVDLVARVNGYLKSINYTAGDLVEKGDVLFTIESQTYSDAVREAEAQLANAKSSFDYNSKQYAAMKKALESDAVSQMEVLQAKNAMESAQASIRQAEALLQTSRTNLSYCTVRAPFRGRVSSNIYNVGAYLSGAGAPAKLATIYDDATLNVEFYVDESQTPQITNSGNPTGHIRYNSIPLSFTDTVAGTYTADVFYLDPAVNKSTGTLLVKARVKNPDGELRDGMYANVMLPYDVDPHAVMIMDAAISSDQLGKFIYTVNDSDKITYTPIEVGDLYHDTMRIVSKGIKPGTKYVTKAMLKVRDGMTVKPILTK